MDLSEYTAAGSSNLTLVGKNASTDRWWKKTGTLMSSTPFIYLGGAFLLALAIVGLNVLDSIIFRAREYHWKYIKLL